MINKTRKMNKHILYLNYYTVKLFQSSRITSS